MKNRFFVLLICACAAVVCAAEEKSTLPLPDSGNVTLTLDEYNRLVELAAKPPKRPDVAPLPYSIKHADVTLHVENDGVLGTVSGYAASPGNPAPERLELATIYLRYAASAIERERLLTEVSRRNRVLESLRGLLESLAGPERLQGGLEISLLALVDGLGADTAAGGLPAPAGNPEARACDRQLMVAKLDIHFALGYITPILDRIVDDPDAGRPQEPAAFLFRPCRRPH